MGIGLQTPDGCIPLRGLNTAAPAGQAPCHRVVLKWQNKKEECIFFMTPEVKSLCCPQKVGEAVGPRDQKKKRLGVNGVFA